MKNEYDFETPGLTDSVSFGEPIVFNNPEKNIHKVLVNKRGCLQNFPGIKTGSWTSEVSRDFDDYPSGRIRFRTSFERKVLGVHTENGRLVCDYGTGFRIYWEIQPDGRYWEDEDGFGGTNDPEIILYADLDEEWNYETPFRIYSVGGERIDQNI